MKLATIWTAVKTIARTKLVQSWRRIWGQNSADELKRRRQHEKEIDDILRGCGGGGV